MFVGRNDGRLTALDTANGAQLWEFQTGAGMNAPVSTFEHNGKQYVVALSRAASFFPGTTRGDSVWLFALDGGLQPAARAATLRALRARWSTNLPLGRATATYGARS